MRIFLTSLFIFLIHFNSEAQLDGTKKSGEFKIKNYKEPEPEKEPEKTTEESKDPKATIEYKSILDKNEDEYLKKFTKKKEEKVEPIMVEKPKPKYDYNEELKNKLNGKKSEVKVGNSKNQDLGQFSTNSFFIKIACRDHQEPDGDLVSIILNDTVIVEKMVLEGEYRTVYIQLRKGKNRIEFVALNQGLSGPNTAAFTIFDEFDKLVSSNEWNLNTGVRATITIMNETKVNSESTNKPESEIKKDDTELKGK